MQQIDFSELALFGHNFLMFPYEQFVNMNIGINNQIFKNVGDRFKHYGHAWASLHHSREQYILIKIQIVGATVLGDLCALKWAGHTRG